MQHVLCFAACTQGKWRFIGIANYKFNNPGGDCYWVGGISNIHALCKSYRWNSRIKLLLHFNQYALNMTSGFGWFLLRFRRKIHMMYIKGLDFLNQVGSNLVSAGLSKQVEFTIAFQQRFCLTDIETGHEKYKDRKCKKWIGLSTHRKSGSWSRQTCKFREHQKLMNPYYIGDSPWESTWYFHGTLHEIQTFLDQNWGLVFRNFLHLSHPEICLEETMFERFLRRILCIIFIRFQGFIQHLLWHVC